MDVFYTKCITKCQQNVFTKHYYELGIVKPQRTEVVKYRAYSNRLNPVSSPNTLSLSSKKKQRIVSANVNKFNILFSLCNKVKKARQTTNKPS